MPVPCKRDFGLAGDAATTAKRMQNNAAVEANLKSYPAPIGRGDDCNHSGQARPQAYLSRRHSAANRSKAGSRELPSTAERSIAARREAAGQLTRCKFCAMFSGSPPSNPMQDIPVSKTSCAPSICWIPIMVRAANSAFSRLAGPENTRLKSAAFYQASASVEIPATSSDAPRMIALSAGKPRRNPVGNRDKVSIGGQNLCPLNSRWLCVG